MNEKAGFANEIYYLGADGYYMANECERYGMTWGCDGDCPVFRRGDCKMDDPDAMADMILHTDRFDGYEIEQLVELYPVLKPLL